MTFPNLLVGRTICLENDLWVQIKSLSLNKTLKTWEECFLVRIWASGHFNISAMYTWGLMGGAWPPKRQGTGFPTRPWTLLRVFLATQVLNPVEAQEAVCRAVRALHWPRVKLGSTSFLGMPAAGPTACCFPAPYFQVITLHHSWSLWCLTKFSSARMRLEALWECDVTVISISHGAHSTILNVYRRQKPHKWWQCHSSMGFIQPLASKNPPVETNLTKRGLLGICFLGQHTR